MNFRKSSKGGGGSFSIQKFMLQIFAIIDNTLVMNFRKNCNITFRKWGGGIKGRLELFRKFIRFGCARHTKEGSQFYEFVSPLSTSVLFWTQCGEDCFIFQTYRFWYNSFYSNLCVLKKLWTSILWVGNKVVPLIAQVYEGGMSYRGNWGREEVSNTGPP